MGKNEIIGLDNFTGGVHSGRISSISESAVCTDPDCIIADDTDDGCAVIQEDRFLWKTDGRDKKQKNNI